MADPSRTAAEITAALGGAGNITDIENCITRLRIGVADVAAVDTDRLKATPDVLGVVVDDTMQVVLGPGLVDDVARHMSAAADAPLTAGPAGASAEDLSARGAEIKARQKARNQTPVKNFLRRIANIFLPLIPALIAAGIIAGVNGILTNLVTNGSAPWLAGVTPPSARSPAGS